MKLDTSPSSAASPPPDERLLGALILIESLATRALASNDALAWETALRQIQNEAQALVLTLAREPVNKPVNKQVAQNDTHTQGDER